jgi:hypothetical protein
MSLESCAIRVDNIEFSRKCEQRRQIAGTSTKSARAAGAARYHARWRSRYVRVFSRFPHRSDEHHRRLLGLERS